MTQCDEKEIRAIRKGSTFHQICIHIGIHNNKIKKMNGYQKTKHLIGMGILNFVLYIVKLSRLLKIYCNHWN